MKRAKASFRARWLPIRRGFTLVEIMITLAVAAILAAMAVPAMQQVMAARATDSAAEDLVASLRLARSEALKRGYPVSVCASVDGASCAGSNVQWKAGWLVFTDDNRDGVLNGSEKAIRVRSASGKGVGDIVTATAFVTFERNGTAIAGSQQPIELRPNITASSSAYPTAVRTVCVNNIGRVLVQKMSVTVCP